MLEKQNAVTGMPCGESEKVNIIHGYYTWGTRKSSLHLLSNPEYYNTLLYVNTLLF